MTDRLQNKVAIITGAGTGIGEAIAYKFASEGARILLVGLPDDPVSDVRDALAAQGADVDCYLGDISREEEAKAAIAFCLDVFGRIDILVNNAGVFTFSGETQDYETEKFREILTMNIASVFYMTREALPHLRKTRGNVISAGSESGMIGLANNTVYGGTKGWIHAFMRGVAAEQGKYGIRANCVCPGPIDTAWTHKETGPMTGEMEKSLTSATVFGRRGTVEEVANVYAFLASEEASYVTGALWTVDGATTILKGPAGDQAEDSVRAEPQPDFPLRHTHDGLKNKDVRSAM